jgi:hypothetical protein
MVCSKCGGKTSVVSTRTINKPGRGSEVNRVAKVVDWYTCDFVARNRKCVDCGYVMMTAELILTDVSAMIQEAVDGHAPEDVS